jgi:hypothetical protein
MGIPFAISPSDRQVNALYIHESLPRKDILRRVKVFSWYGELHV